MIDGHQSRLRHNDDDEGGGGMLAYHSETIAYRILLYDLFIMNFFLYEYGAGEAFHGFQKNYVCADAKSKGPYISKSLKLTSVIN